MGLSLGLTELVLELKLGLIGLVGVVVRGRVGVNWGWGLNQGWGETGSELGLGFGDPNVLQGPNLRILRDPSKPTSCLMFLHQN